MAAENHLSPTTSRLLSQRNAVGCLVGAWLLSMFTQGYIIVPASVLPTITAEFGIPSTTAVWIVSAAPGAWALTNFGLGIGIDTFGDVTATAVAVLVVVLASILSMWAATHHLFWHLLLARGIAGAGIGVIWTASANVVGQAFTDATRGTALGIFTTSAPAGFALGQVLTPVVARTTGWSAMFGVVAAGSVLALGLFWLSVRTVERRRGAPAGNVRQNVLQVVKSRAVLCGCAMAFAAYSLYLFMNSWMPTYLAQNFTISLTVSGLLTALFPAVGIVSRAGGGYVSDRVLGQRRLPALKTSFLLALPVTVLIANAASVRLVAVLLLVGGFVIQLTFGIVYSYVQEAVTPDLSGTALSLLGTAGISGAFSAPLIAGALIGATDAYVSAFAYAVGVAALGILLAWVAPESAA